MRWLPNSSRSLSSAARTRGAMSAANPLEGFRVDRSKIEFIGHDLQRPECILAERDGTLWSADARGGVVRIRPDGNQEIITQKSATAFAKAADEEQRFTQGTLPNGLAFARDGNFLIANFGTDCLEVMTRRGESHVLIDSIDGKPIGKVNFVLRDSRDRIWITVSTRIQNWMTAMRPDIADGYIALYDGKRLRVVADGLAFTNEIRLDAGEEWMYAVETTGQRVTRFRVGADGALTGREVFGPAKLGPGGFPDGIAFDACLGHGGHHLRHHARWRLPRDPQRQRRRHDPSHGCALPRRHTDGAGDAAMGGQAGPVVRQRDVRRQGLADGLYRQPARQPDSLFPLAGCRFPHGALVS